MAAARAPTTRPTAPACVEAEPCDGGVPLMVVTAGGGGGDGGDGGGDGSDGGDGGGDGSDGGDGGAMNLSGWLRHARPNKEGSGKADAAVLV